MKINIIAPMKIQNTFRPAIFTAVLSVAVFGSLSATRAQNINWTDAGSGFWTNAASWSLAAAPSNNPNVNIVNAGSKTVTIDAGTPAGNLTITNLAVYSTAFGATNTLYLSGNSSALNVLGTLTLGSGAGQAGALVMDNGGQLVATNNPIYVGITGIGNMTVSNGQWLANAVTVGNSAGSSGTLNIFGGTNIWTGNSPIGNNAGATGVVNVTGGQLVATNSAGNLETYVGLTGIGNMTVSGGQWLADSLYVGVFSQSSGTLTFSGGTNLFKRFQIAAFSASATGNVFLTGGQLVMTNNTSYVGQSGVGAMTVSGGQLLAGRISVGEGLGSSGTLNISGGTNVLLNILDIGSSAVGATGVVNVTGGQLVTTNSATYVGDSGVGAMTVSNGTWLGSRVYVGNNAGSKGTLNISGGTNLLAIGLYVGSSAGATGAVNVTGGNFTVTNAGTGQLVVGSSGAGLFTLSGGAVSADQLWVTNGANSGFSATGGRMVAGSATIGSSFSLTNSTGIFSNLTVTSFGSLSGTNGNLVISRDFINQSTNRAQFDLSRSALFFTNGVGTTAHTLNLTNSLALDMGAVGMNAAQLATNFSIGTLSISLSNNVVFTGVKSGAATNALYVGWLDLSAWNTNAGSLNSTLLAALTLPDINLYYDASDARNAYLQDASYALWGGGGLLIPIPEPSSLALLLLGPAWILARRRLWGARGHVG